MKNHRALLLLAVTAALLFAAVRLLQPGLTTPPLPSGAEPGAAVPPARAAEAPDLPMDRTETPPLPPSPRSGYVRDLAQLREEGATRGYRIVREDESGLSLEIDFPAYRLEKGGPEGEETRIAIAGYLDLEEPGRPSLPALVVSVPLPGVESVEVSAETSPARDEHGIYLTPAPGEESARRGLERIWLEKAADPEQISAFSPRWQEFARAARRRHEDRPAEIDPPVREEDWYPERVVESSGPLWRGEEQFVNLRVSPLRYSAAGGTVESRERVTVEIAFGAPAKALPKKTAIDYGAQFELSASPDSFLASVTEDGIQIVTYGDLADAGFDLGGDPRSLRVYLRGEEIPVHISGEETGTWNPGDYLAFWGEGDPGFYTQTRTYWLYQTAGTGIRMEEAAVPRSGRPSRQESFLDRRRLEERISYQPNLPVPAGNDCWFWDFAGYHWDWQGSFVNFTSNINFTLHGVSGREGMVSFAARYFGFTTYENYNPDHHTRVYLNGHLLGDFTWNGQVFYNFQAEIPQSLFQEGTNTITTVGVDDLGLPPSGEFVFIDYFDIEYYRDYQAAGDRLVFTASGKGDYRVAGFGGGDLALYEVTDPAGPRRLADFNVLTGGDYTLDFRKLQAGEEKYWAGRFGAAPRPPLVRNTPSDLISPRSVDYVIVTHPDFRTAIEPLADHRRAGGLEVEIFEIADIYNTFGFGDFTPKAIQRFLQYGYLEWDAQTRPRYALLVGDGNYDYQNYLGASPPNYIPPYMFRSQFMETASDNWYACLIGDDRVPDIDIGRFAVNSAAETAVMVEKTIDYELAAGGLPWQRQVLMVADNPDPAAGNFPADSDWLIANYLPSSFTAQTVYRPNLSLAATRTAILNGINDGKLLVNYIGHGQVDFWSSPFIFRSLSIPSLNNADRLHLMTTPTCLNGYWCDVIQVSLAEAMTRTAGKGAVAAISPSGWSLNTPARQLTGFLFEEMLADQHPAGTALSRAKARLDGVSPWKYMLDIYTLFGDPALSLK